MTLYQFSCSILQITRHAAAVCDIAEVENDDDPTSELSYETEYHTPVVIAGLLEDVPNRLVPIGDLEITRGGFEEEVRDGDEDSDQELESLASQVAERTLEEEDDQQVVGLSHDCLINELRLPLLDPFRRGVFRWD